jgi:membrane fusion protein, heavy metal efflux system
MRLGYMRHSKCKRLCGKSPAAATGPWLALVMAASLLAAAGCSRHGDNSGADTDPVIVQGDKLVVPEGSPLRSRLVVQPVASEAVPHAVVVPGMVEADPARTVSVLPPLT